MNSPQRGKEGRTNMETKMTITIDKDFTTLGAVKSLKEAVAEFKNRYTVGDLLRAYNEVFRNDYTDIDGDILRCDISAFKMYEFDEASFKVSLWVTNGVRVYKIRFYADVNLNVNDDPLLMNLEQFRIVLE